MTNDPKILHRALEILASWYCGDVCSSSMDGDLHIPTKWKNEAIEKAEQEVLE